MKKFLSSFVALTLAVIMTFGFSVSVFASTNATHTKGGTYYVTTKNCKDTQLTIRVPRNYAGYFSGNGSSLGIIIYKKNGNKYTKVTEVKNCKTNADGYATTDKSDKIRVVAKKWKLNQNSKYKVIVKINTNDKKVSNTKITVEAKNPIYHLCGKATVS